MVLVKNLLPFLAWSETMKLAITTVLDFPGTTKPAYRFQTVTVKGSLGAFSLYGNQKNYEKIQATRHKS